MNCERPMSQHLERALVETLFAIAEFDVLRAQATARDQVLTNDTLGGLLLLLRATLDSAIMMAHVFAQPGALQPGWTSQQPVKR